MGGRRTGDDGHTGATHRTTRQDTQCEPVPCPASREKERKKTDNPREGWEDGTPPPHRDFKERGVVR